jgi:hypothetical protein
MIILLILSLLSAALMLILKVFSHYNLIRNNDADLKNVDFGDFFYSGSFSKKRIITSFKLYSLRLINRSENEFTDFDNDIPKINRYLKLMFIFLVFAVVILSIGLLTGSIS